MLIMIRGAGDIATGIAWRLRQSHFQIIMTDLPMPTAIRRTVAFSTALETGRFTVEGITAVACHSPEEALKACKEGLIAVLPDPELQSLPSLSPKVLVDAVLAKRNLGTHITDAPLVIGVGPGFCAGKDCHYIVETKRGHTRGRVVDRGEAAPNSGVPGNIGGYTRERILRAPCDGVFSPLREIGDVVCVGDVVAMVGDEPIRVEISGMLRGMLREGISVTKGFKCGDVDPRGDSVDFRTISDKARAVGGGVLEAVMRKFGGLLDGAC